MIKTQHGREPFSRNKLALAVSTALALGPMPVLAAPTGGVVVNGSAAIGQSRAATNITQHTQKAAINWQGFSVGQGETVNFQQPNASSITLNRVVGNERSVIEGALKANGQIFLVNSNGVLFTRGSSVNAAGLVASTLDISNEDFEAGRYVFQDNGGSGSVINMGTLSAADGGYVALLGKEALNQGMIVATRGTAALGAGERITLNFNGDSLLSVSIGQGALDALVENKAAIYADGGKVFLTARAADDLLGSQVNNDGVIQAQTLDDLKGEIVAHAYGGTANIAGALDASAPAGGDGGFIETSGDKVKIAESANITTRSETGETGQWLIDPDGYTIANSGGDISATQLASFLAKNLANITIESTLGSGSDGDLNVNDAVSWSSNTKLTLKATDDVNVNATISAKGDAAGLTLTAGDDINVNAGITLSGGNAALAMNYGGDYNILTPASFSGTVLDADGKPVAKQDTSGGKYGSITLSGSGSSLKLNDQDYTLIRSMDDLAAISGTVGHYALAKNLDAANWSSANMGAGTVVESLSGVLTGLGHTVGNLTILASGIPNNLTGTGSWSLGLIGKAINPTTVRDIGIVNADISALDTTVSAGGGILAANFQGIIFNAYSTGRIKGTNGIGGLAGVFMGTMSNAYSTADVVGGNIDLTGGNAGGLIGRATAAELKNVHATGNVTLTGEKNGFAPDSGGGLVGWMANSSIANAYAMGSVDGTDSSTSLGGLVGNMQTKSAVPISVQDSFATGDVTGGKMLGGLIGQIKVNGTKETPVTVKNSYATGNVTANYPQMDALPEGTGGLIGFAGLGTNAGMLTIDSSFATGKVVLSDSYGGTGLAGGLIGQLNTKAGTITNSYATGDVYAANSNGIGGLIGNARSRGRDGYMLTISGSHAAGNVTGSRTVGGLIGSLGGDFSKTTSPTISASWSSGKVTSTVPSTELRAVGGLIGQGYNVNINSDVYYNAEGVSGAFGNIGSNAALIGTDNSQGLTGEQVRDMEYYANGTIDQVLADRAAAEVAAQAAAQAAAEAAAQAAAEAAAQAAAEAAAQAAAEAAAQAAAEAAAQAAAEAASQAVANTASQLGAAHMAEVRRQSIQSSGTNTQSAAAPPSIDNNIVFTDPGSYSAHVRRIEVDGVIYDLDEEDNDLDKEDKK
ncbi:filamentous hemagglutinin N-terminal domain-containing protein [Methylobacter sp.]|uniref:two-partner secretion domain-containing protein n=1 Tax=Methylobacter sp. TaxID=2051955 RepID=UPI003DA392CE